jgi:hypothetical protein
MALMVSHQPNTMQAQLQFQVSPCEICGHSGNTTGFFISTSVFPINIIPPILDIHLHLQATLIRKTNGQSLGTFQKSNAFFRNQEAPDIVVLPLFKISLQRVKFIRSRKMGWAGHIVCIRAKICKHRF